MAKIIGVDPGSSKSGLIYLIDDSIQWTEVVSNKILISRIAPEIEKSGCIVVIEDFRPYSVRISSQAIDTCKFIGELKYRLECELKAPVRMISRFEVKRWVFERFRHISLPLIEAKIKKKESKKRASYMWVDDLIVTECMKRLYKIERPPNGRGYPFGLKAHSWQALAVASYFSSSGEK